MSLLVSLSGYNTDKWFLERDKFRREIVESASRKSIYTGKKRKPEGGV